MYDFSQFRTNVGELTLLMLKSNADLVIITKTFLDDSVPLNYAKEK